MFPTRMFADRYFAPRVFPKTGMALVTTGAWALMIPLGIKALVQPTQPGSAVVTVGSGASVSQKAGSAATVTPRGSAAVRVERKGSAVT
jgi:hypothetical protein